MAVPSAMVGKTAANWVVAGENDTASLSYTAQYDNIVVTNGSGTVKSTIFANAADKNLSGTLFSPAGVASSSVTTPVFGVLNDRLQLAVTNDASATSNRYTYNNFSNINYTFVTGDYIEYDVKLLNSVFGSGGIDITNTDGSLFRNSAGWVDQNGVTGHPGGDISSYAYNVWFHRKLAVPSSMIGKTASQWEVAGENDTASLMYSAQYDNVKVTDGGSTVKSTIFC